MTTNNSGDVLPARPLSTSHLKFFERKSQMLSLSCRKENRLGF
jgi:hypothetical protein